MPTEPRARSQMKLLLRIGMVGALLAAGANLVFSVIRGHYQIAAWSALMAGWVVVAYFWQKSAESWERIYRNLDRILGDMAETDARIAELREAINKREGTSWN